MRWVFTTLTITSWVLGASAITNGAPSTSLGTAQDWVTSTPILAPPELLPGVNCTCVDVRLCPILDIRSGFEDVRSLSESTCGFRGFVPYVCCEAEPLPASETYTSTTQKSLDDGNDRRTPSVASHSDERSFPSERDRVSETYPNTYHVTYNGSGNATAGKSSNQPTSKETLRKNSNRQPTKKPVRDQNEDSYGKIPWYRPHEVPNFGQPITQVPNVASTKNSNLPSWHRNTPQRPTGPIFIVPPLWPPLPQDAGFFPPPGVFVTPVPHPGRPQPPGTLDGSRVNVAFGECGNRVASPNATPLPSPNQRPTKRSTANQNSKGTTPLPPINNRRPVRPTTPTTTIPAKSNHNITTPTRKVEYGPKIATTSVPYLAADRRPRVSSSPPPPRAPNNGPQRRQVSTTPETVASDVAQNLDASTIPSEKWPSLEMVFRRQKTRALLPEEECGLTIDDRIIGGSTAALGAFPWVVRLGYVKSNSRRVLYRCGGSLISSRYVITAAHCVTGLPGGLRLANVRLGDTDALSDPDCNHMHCADPVQDIPPQKVIVHPRYDRPQYMHDVALVRLSRPANFSAYVSPICLPFGAIGQKNYTGLKAVVAGWGATSMGLSSSSDSLQWVRLTVNDLQACAHLFSNRASVTLGSGQLCAGGSSGRDSCQGDSGGPLMRPEQPDDTGPPRYFLLGLVSFGAKICGADRVPGVYTRVGHYTDWVLDSLEP